MEKKIRVVNGKYFPLLQRGHSKKRPCAAVAKECDKHPESHEFESCQSAAIAWAEERGVPIFAF